MRKVQASELVGKILTCKHCGSMSKVKISDLRDVYIRKSVTCPYCLGWIEIPSELSDINAATRETKQPQIQAQIQEVAKDKDVEAILRSKAEEIKKLPAGEVKSALMDMLDEIYEEYLDG